MKTLSFFNPKFSSDFFDVIDRNFYGRCGNPEMPKRFVPKVDVKETKDSYIIDMELAGFSEDKVDIELQDRILTISSKREHPRCQVEKEVENPEKNSIATEEKEVAPKPERQEIKWLVKERGFGLKHFSRSFTLPEDIDGENVSANFKNGLLTISVPKKTETKSRKIAISA
jgi:HSP20 family protein